MKLDKYHLIFLGAMVVFIILWLKSCENKKNNEKEQLGLIAALQDSVHHYKDKDSINVARIAVIETEKVSTFLKLKSIDSSVIALQSLVESYKKQLSHGGSATNIGGTTHIDTTLTHTIVKSDTVVKDSITYIYPIYLDTIKNKWLTYTSETNRTSHRVNIKFNNEYSVIIGTDKGKAFADVKSYSPYDSIGTVRTYQVSTPKPKKWSLGVGLNYGIRENFKFGFQAGVYLGYNLIRF